MPVMSITKPHLGLPALLLLRALLLCLLTTAPLLQHANGAMVELPQVLGSAMNVSAAMGKTAKLQCKVNNLNKYKVAWFHMDRQMLLTIDTIVVTRIPRFSVTRDDEITWTLHIQDVSKEDRGEYYCQLNTEPVTNQKVFLNVVVPPEIVDAHSSGSSVVVQENGNVTLTCEAEGNPKPTISWVREDTRQISLSKRNRVHKHPGSTLVLSKVSRNDMGAYLCIASNGYPPSVSKRIVLNVQFSPVVVVPNQLMSTPRGINVTLDCYTEASPKAFTFWRYNDTMVMSGPKYHLAETTEGFKTWLKLTITQVGPEDFGKYQCYSRNSFGENDGQVNLHEMAPAVPRADKIKNNEIEENSIFVKSSHHGRSRSQNQLIFNGVDVSDGSSKGGSHHHDDNRINEDNRVNSISKHNSNDDKIEERLIDIFSGTSSSSRIHFHSSFLLLLLMMLLLPSILRGPR